MANECPPVQFMAGFQAVIIFKAFQFEPHPVDWANLLYWMIAAFPIFCVPLWALYYVCKTADVSAGPTGLVALSIFTFSRLKIS